MTWMCPKGEERTLKPILVGLKNNINNYDFNFIEYVNYLHTL